MRSAIAKCILSQIWGQAMMLSIHILTVYQVSLQMRVAIPVVRAQEGRVELLDPLGLAETKGHVLKFKLERKVPGTHQMPTVHSAKSHLSQLPTSYRPEPRLFCSKTRKQTVVPLKYKCSCVQFPRR